MHTVLTLHADAMKPHKLTQLEAINNTIHTCTHVADELSLFLRRLADFLHLCRQPRDLPLVFVCLPLCQPAPLPQLLLPRQRLLRELAHADEQRGQLKLVVACTRDREVGTACMQGDGVTLTLQ